MFYDAFHALNHLPALLFLYFVLCFTLKIYKFIKIYNNIFLIKTYYYTKSNFKLVEFFIFFLIKIKISLFFNLQFNYSLKLLII